MSADLPQALRWARAAVLTAAVVAVSCAAHLAGGGGLPQLSVVALLTAPALALSAALLGRPAPAGRLLALLAAGQAGMHLALTATAPCDPSGTSSMPGGGLRMLGAHVAATGALGWWLAAAERRIWRLLSVLVRAGAERLRRVVKPSLGQQYLLGPAAVLVTCAEGRPPLESLSVALTRRGPPVAAS